MKRPRLWVGAAAVAIVLVLFGATAVVLELRKSTLISLQHCVDHPTHAFFGWACRQVMRTKEPPPDEVAHMNANGGAHRVFNAKYDDDARALLRRYLAAGLNINAVDHKVPQVQWTSLHLAALNGELRQVRILLEFGADPSLQDAQGHTAADLARLKAQKSPDSEAKYLEVAQALDEAGRKR